MYPSDWLIFAAACLLGYGLPWRDAQVNKSKTICLVVAVVLIGLAVVLAIARRV